MFAGVLEFLLENPDVDYTSANGVIQMVPATEKALQAYNARAVAAKQSSTRAPGPQMLSQGMTWQTA